jgi:hypothetical protein
MGRSNQVTPNTKNKNITRLDKISSKDRVGVTKSKSSNKLNISKKKSTTNREDVVGFIKRPQIRKAMVLNNLYHSSEDFENAIVDDLSDYCGHILKKSLELEILKRKGSYAENSNFLVRLQKDTVEHISTTLYGCQQLGHYTKSCYKKNHK